MQRPALPPRALLIVAATAFLGAAGARGEVRIEEFMAANASTAPDPNGEVHDWIELHNPTAETVSLDGYTLTDAEDSTPGDPATHWRLPAVQLAAGAYLLVYASGRTDPDPGGALHAPFRLSREGERLALFGPDGGEAITGFDPYPPQETDVSYGRRSDGQWEYQTRPTPGRSNRPGATGLAAPVRFSVDRRFHDAPFSVTLETDTPGATILYTTDGREPAPGTLFAGPVGAVYTGPLTIATTTVLRARAVGTDLVPGASGTRTYLFLDDVLDQPARPTGFPERWGSRPADYEMDPEVVGALYPREEVRAALLDLPTLSLVTDTDHLFDGARGIYANSQAKDLVNDGIDDAWERPVSVEMFGFPHGKTVQANAGIRMQGNASRTPDRRKHNLRVIFRRAYGPGKLRFRLFEDSEVDTFNSINLRSNNGDSWIHPGVRPRAQYIRDQWHRVVQERMGQPAQSQIYAHLYINGLYWGLYHVFERFEASLLAEHWGGEEGDWDALQDTPSFQDIVVDGSDEAYRHTFDLAGEDLSDPSRYRAVLDYVDPDNLIDYLLLNFYSSNQDWDHKNMRYGRRRQPLGGATGDRWMFFAWDSERHGLNGLSSTAVNSDVTGRRTSLGPTSLNVALQAQPDYRLRFSDRVVRHLFHDGILTPGAAAREWQALADRIYLPLVAESARWGDLHAARPETREGNWQAQLDRELEAWFPARTEILLDQLDARGFADDKPPHVIFEPFGGTVEAGQTVPMRVAFDTLFRPVPGDIVYTTEGSDPRRPDGSLHPEARRYQPDAPPAIERATLLRARVFDPPEGWTALAEAWFALAAPPAADTLTVSEIHCRPGDPAHAFVELQNMSPGPLDLSGLALTRGVRATVAPSAGAVVAAGACAVLVADREAFLRRYPEVDPGRILGEFADDSRLDPDGERLTVRGHDGRLLHSFRYAPGPAWPAAPDDGRSYEHRATSASIARASDWSLSPAPGGSPGSPPAGPAGNPFTDWLAGQGLDGPLAPFGPGQLPAILTFAHGLDASAGGGPSTPSLSLAADGSARLVSLRREDAAGLEWQVEASRDLRSWEPVPASSREARPRAGSPGARVVTETFAAEAVRAYRFWRLRVRATAPAP